MPCKDEASGNAATSDVNRKDSDNRGGESGRTSELQSENMFSNIQKLEEKMHHK